MNSIDTQLKRMMPGVLQRRQPPPTKALVRGHKNLSSNFIDRGINKIIGDSDKDKVPNWMDCEPYNKNKQGVIHGEYAYLYHGTTENVLPKILKEGLQPHNTMWGPPAVFLTPSKSGAMNFAMRGHFFKRQNPVLLEVKVPRSEIKGSRKEIESEDEFRQFMIKRPIEAKDIKKIDYVKKEKIKKIQPLKKKVIFGKVFYVKTHPNTLFADKDKDGIIAAADNDDNNPNNPSGMHFNETPHMKRIRKGRGYKDIVYVSAKELENRFEKDQHEKLAWNEERLKSAREREEYDSYAQVGFMTDNKTITVNDGRHRIAAAAERGEVIPIAVRNKRKFIQVFPSASLKKQQEWQAMTPQQKVVERIQKKDTDNDGVPDEYDCEPKNPDKQEVVVFSAGHTPKVYSFREHLTPYEQMRAEFEDVRQELERKGVSGIDINMKEIEFIESYIDKLAKEADVKGASKEKQQEWKSMPQEQKTLKRFVMKDTDNDGTPDKYDCEPNNPNKQEFDILRTGEGYNVKSSITGDMVGTGFPAWDDAMENIVGNATADFDYFGIPRKTVYFQVNPNNEEQMLGDTGQWVVELKQSNAGLYARDQMGNPLLFDNEREAIDWMRKNRPRPQMSIDEGINSNRLGWLQLQTGSDMGTLEPPLIKLGDTRRLTGAYYNIDITDKV